LLVVQLSMDVPFNVTDVGFADNVTVGAGCVAVDTVTERLALPPPELVHDSVKLVLAAIGPTVSLPEVAFDPLHPDTAGLALAVQLVACVVLHVS
jgi:hypothetical protein